MRNEASVKARSGRYCCERRKGRISNSERISILVVVEGLLVGQVYAVEEYLGLVILILVKAVDVTPSLCRCFNVHLS